MKKNIIVVDGYSTGNLYAPQFTAKGYTVHHIQSSNTIIDIFKPSFKEHDYASNFVFNGDVDALYTHVRSLAPAVILPGAESGVDLSEELCIAFNLFANDAALLDNRKSKAKMNDALKRQGMLTAKQHCFTAIDCLKNWLGELDELDWPVVLKPIDSVASDGLFICNSYKECISAANSLLNKDNLLGKKIPAFWLNHTFMAHNTSSMLLVEMDNTVSLMSGIPIERVLSVPNKFWKTVFCYLHRTLQSLNYPNMWFRVCKPLGLITVHRT